MSKEVKVNYANTFATIHSRNFYRGKSFEYAGEWIEGAHYNSDDYTIDFVSKDNTLLACAKSHIASEFNEPIDFIKDERGTIIGIVSEYWDFVCSGAQGKSPMIRINTNTMMFEICDDSNLPEEKQTWTFVSFNEFLPKSGGSMKGSINMQHNRILNVPSPLTSTDVTNKAYVDEKINMIKQYIDDKFATLGKN